MSIVTFNSEILFPFSLLMAKLFFRLLFFVFKVGILHKWPLLIPQWRLVSIPIGAASHELTHSIHFVNVLLTFVIFFTGERADQYLPLNIQKLLSYC